MSRRRVATRNSARRLRRLGRGVVCRLRGVSAGGGQPGPELGLTSPSILACIVGFFVFGAAFFYVSTHVTEPTIDLSLYKTRNFTVAVVCAFVSFLALAPINHLMPFYMENVQGLHIRKRV